MTASGSLFKNLTPEEFALFRDYINEHAGIFLEESGMDSLRISLVARATRFACRTLGEYFAFLNSSDTEFRELLNLVTINETSFFRFPAQFDVMRETVIPAILESKPEENKVFRVWSAGCSTGEEPYSIGMTLLDSGIEGLGYRLEVLGTDVSTNALERARRAVYPPRALHNVSDAVTSKYFEPTAEGNRVVPQVRKIVAFNYHNLVKEPFLVGLMGNWDVIFCRNVTIYFQIESTRRVVDNFFNALNPGGYLFVGHSETLTGITDRFQPVETGEVFIYRKPITPYAQGFTVQPGRRRDAGLPSPVRVAGSKTRKRVVREVSRAMLEEDPDLLDARLVAAYRYADAGEFDAALAEVTRVLESEPLLSSARYILSLINLRTGRTEEAIRELKRTIYVDPDFVLAHFNLANIHRARGEMGEAAREYENCIRALRSNPEGSWVAFLGGFRADLLEQTCQRGLLECR